MKQAFSKKNILLGVVALILAGYCLVWLTVIFAGEFTDERENFVAGWFVSQGLVPYKDFFFHHAPLPFFIAALAEWIQSSFWFSLRILIFVWWSALLTMTLKNVNRKLYVAVAFSWLFSALSSVQFLIHMYLAESLVIPVMVSLIFLLFSAYIYETKNATQFLWIFFIAGWVAIWSTIISALPLTMLGLAAAAVYKRSVSHPTLIRPALVATILHSLIIMFFLLNGALQDAWWNIVAYNIDHYYSLRLAGSITQAERGFLFGIIERFFSDFYFNWLLIIQNTYIALQTASGLIRASVQTMISINEWLIIPSEWWNKTASASVFSSWLIGIIVIIITAKRKWFLAMWIVLFFISLKSRDNEPFKIGMFVLPVFSVGLIVLTEQWLKKNHVSSVALIIPLILMLGSMSVTFFSSNRLNSPIIPPEVFSQAEYLERELPKDEKEVLIIGGIPDQYLFAQRLPANKYYYYHQWFHDVDEIRQEVRSFVENNKNHPIILQSELNHQPLGFAEDLEDNIRQSYVKQSPAIYLPKVE